MALDANGGGPLYQQLRQELFSRIRRGEFATGEMLPSENQLCEEYGVSVTTARRALLELVKEGVVRRRVGVGTMVAPQVRQARLAVVSIGYVGTTWRRVSFGMAEEIVGVGEQTWSRDASFTMSGLGEERSDDYLRSLVESRSVDGVLLRTAEDIRESHLDILEGAGMPYVVIKRELAGRPMNCVVGDDLRGGRLATEHLLAEGHRRIGFVCAKPGLQFTKDRQAGYREALAAAGVAYDPQLVRLEASFAEDRGERAVRDLLGMGDRPTAIFVASDTMAIGGYRAAHELGLGIPAQVALVGYDDIGAAAVLAPPLTTVRTAYYDFGRLAAQLVLDLIEGRVSAPQRSVIEPELIVRQSTGRPPERARRPPRARAAAAGMLAQRRVLVTGVALAAEALRAGVAEAGAEAVSEASDFDAALCVVDLRVGLEEGLTVAAAEVDRIAARLAPRHAGAIALAVAAPGATGTPLAAAGTAAVRGLVGDLARRWAPSGVRVNAALIPAEGASAAVGPSLFLLSEAASLTGQVVETGQL